MELDHKGPFRFAAFLSVDDSLRLESMMIALESKGYGLLLC